MKQDGNTPSVSLAFPPVGWLSTAPHDSQETTIAACEKMVVILKQTEKEKKKRVKHEHHEIYDKVHTMTLDIHKK